MHVIRLPKTDDSTGSATMLEWLKTEGAAVAQGDLLARLEAERAFVELESNQSGTLLKTLIPKGATVAPDEPLALLGEPGEDTSATLARLEAEREPPRADIGEPPTLPDAPESKPTDKPLEAAPDAEVATGRKAPTSAATARVEIAAPPAKEPSPMPESPAAPEPAPAAAPCGEVQPILMPQVGQSMEEGTILEWRVQPGDRIEVGQIIFEVETDKANIEVEADHAGRLAKIVAQVDDIVAVKEPVAYLAENDADVEAYLAAQAPPSETGNAGAVAAVASPAASPSAATAAPSSASAVPAAPVVSAPLAPAVVESGRVKASPAARRIAGERGVDLRAVGAGSGPGGRILSTDVERAPAASEAGPVRRRMSAMRRAIARNLVASKQTVPHFYMRLTVDAAPMLAFYRERKAQHPCSLNDVLVAACARVIAEFPAFRTRVDGEDYVEFPTANVGIAVGLEDGLVVPVVVGADRLPFERLAAETRRVAEAARSGKIEGLGQGVFTISNLGMFGVEEFSAIVNPPESAILAAGAVREAVLVRDGAIRPAQVLTMTLSCDHRVVDGVLAAQYLARLKVILEDPGELS